MRSKVEAEFTDIGEQRLENIAPTARLPSRPVTGDRAADNCAGRIAAPRQAVESLGLTVSPSILGRADEVIE
jgi:hypothetical protein